MHNFPTLFKKSKGGKVSQWDISVSKNVIYIEHGYTDGKKQKDVRLLKEGKNTDKANATTSEQQAMMEAEAKWKKQKDKGYVESLTTVDEIVYLPMLAQTFDKRKKYIQFPAILQRKYDGVRCFGRVIQHGNSEMVTLSSRNGKLFPHLEHLHASIFEFIKEIAHTTNFILDGELYSDTLSFQEVVGLVKKITLDDEDKKKCLEIGYRLYDCINLQLPDLSFGKRYGFLSCLISTPIKYLGLVTNDFAQNEADIKKFHDQYVAEGYEGIIIRNHEGAYEFNRRSNNLQKFKNFIDDEFEICGFEEGEGRAEGTVVWICKNKKDTTELHPTFKVRPRGTEKERKEWFLNGKKYIGAILTVRYQELQPDTNCPRFPVGISVRDYE